MVTLYTIGHSTRRLEEFLALLEINHIAQLIDVRTIPRSRRYPWFTQAALQIELAKKNIIYFHQPELGGLRHPDPNSINVGWRNAGFRGFADYMQTMPFFLGLKKLNQLLKTGKPTAVMCAEAVPWRCHRSLIADAEIARGVTVLHIISPTSNLVHELTDFAVIDKTKRPIKVFYPKNK